MTLYLSLALCVDRLVGGCDPIYAAVSSSDHCWGPGWSFWTKCFAKAQKIFWPKIYPNRPNMTVASAQTKHRFRRFPPCTQSHSNRETGATMYWCCLVMHLVHCTMLLLKINKHQILPIWLHRQCHRSSHIGNYHPSTDSSKETRSLLDECLD